MGFKRRARIAWLVCLVGGIAAACAHGDEDAFLEPTDPALPRSDASDPARPNGGEHGSSSGNPDGHDDAGSAHEDAGGHRDAGAHVDAGVLPDAGLRDAGGPYTDGGSTSSDGGSSSDGSTPGDGGSTSSDGGTTRGDAGTPADGGATSGVITGGPCISGAAGKTAVRVHFTNAGGRAQAAYDVWGLPDHSRSHAEAYGMSIGFVPQYVDPFLAVGGLQLDSSDFLDIELSTKGVATMRTATLSLYGRSFATSTSGSFSWQTFTGTGATATNFVANSAPYQWYSASLGAALVPGDDRVLLRIKAGPSSGSLVVQAVEICVEE